MREGPQGQTGTAQRGFYVGKGVNYLLSDNIDHSVV